MVANIQSRTFRMPAIRQHKRLKYIKQSFSVCFKCLQQGRQKLRMFANRVQKGIFRPKMAKGTGGW